MKTTNSSSSEVTVREFGFEGAPVRVVIKGGEPWFVAKDVCDALDIKSPRSVYERLVTKGVGETDVLTNGGRQQMTIVDEPNLYMLILRSNKENAVRFQRWVCADVLPSIRKTGSYSVAPTKVPTALELAKKYVAALEQNEILEAKVVEYRPKVIAHDRIAGALDSRTLTDTSKQLGLGRKRFISFLREEAYIDHKNRPYQHALDRGLFATCTTPTNRRKTDMQTRVTGKGLMHFAGELVKKGIKSKYMPEQTSFRLETNKKPLCFPAPRELLQS